jgi:hypothetical protein
MNYEKHYSLLIDKHKGKTRDDFDEYVEHHHINPVFMYKHNKRGSTLTGHLDGDHDDPSNMVYLPLREHLIAHALLAKLYRGTIYENAAASALCFFFSKGMGLKHPRSLLFQAGMSKKYAWMKAKGRAAISTARQGTFPARDVITGKIVGSVYKDDPRVLSGELVHCTKGRKATAETCKRCSRPGMQNGNAKTHITESDIFAVITKAKRHDGRMLASEFWAMLKVELDCTSGMIAVRYNGLRKLLEAYRLAGNSIIYDPYYRENAKEKYTSTKKRCWITDGVDNKQHIITNKIPDGWRLGRTVKRKADA